jgi:transcriptional regulator with XRE-family HTH domain
MAERFGAMLQELRKRSGLTQAELARRSGLPLRSIQNWEGSHRVPRAEAVLALARALGTPVENLLTSVARTTPKRRRGKKGK